MTNDSRPNSNAKSTVTALPDQFETTDPSNDQQWLKSALTEHMDAKVDQLDFNVSSKLSAARHKALTEPEKRSIPRFLTWQSMSAGFAVVALTVVLGMQFIPGTPEQLTRPQDTLANAVDAKTYVDDLTLLSASDDLEFFQSIEFLEWMDGNLG